MKKAKRHGKWVLNDEDNNVWTCPKCEMDWCCLEDWHYENEMYFCPRCGEKIIDEVLL